MLTRIIGQRLIEPGSVPSTNKHAAELLASGRAEHGMVVLAHEQTEGRGQRGRIWRSAAGLDLALSIVLRPTGLSAADQFDLARVAALAVHDVVAEAMRAAVGRTAERVRIKWPNDILIDQRKVSGILIENEVVGGAISSSVVGIGINVNSGELDAEFNATSLRMEAGLELDRMALLETLCQRFEHWYDLLPEPQSLAAAFSGPLWGRGRFMDLELDGKPWNARVVDVGPDGRLLVEDEAGQVQAYGSDRLRFAPRH